MPVVGVAVGTPGRQADALNQRKAKPESPAQTPKTQSHMPSLIWD